MEASIKLKAYAKLNLHLEVLGKRPDGYHDLWSIFHLVSLYDELKFEPLENGRIILTCNNDHLPVNEKNLVVKAARLLQGYLKDHVILRKTTCLPSEESFEDPSACQAISPTQGDTLQGDRLPGAKITLTKNIPIGAGLGGGSSDAAAALQGLPKLWGMEISSPELHRMALGLGSDVPYFLQGGTALVTGRGEKIKPLDWKQAYHFVIVYPGFGVSTAWAYKNLKIPLTKGPGFSKMINYGPSLGPEPGQLAISLCNDLEKAVIPSHPQIDQIKQELVQSGALGALMSGSGSSVFGIFPDSGSARQAALKLKLQWPCCFYAGSQRS
ncbi:4-(cytidine 5'-diphospho)-2-C-methyl-D-erythritol kinase [candidate division TA06 bacterium]|nr:4-(cytidine 5'-diphospho)-2-C-methyl-D-erythritol kinase [candidate division TA06 bacterium]